ncbi:heme-binding protein [Pseudonocardia sp.]|uniref:GlcG/HbpS family heme-binding protein n=1 Tax=Pseudonocardia sp. TaxID=60912 RepID=UPI0031FC3862
MNTLGSVSLEDARRVIAAGEAKANEIGQPMNVAVVDVGGNLVTHIRMDRAWLGSIDISINKAFTARAFDISTAELATNAAPGQQFYGIHVSNRGRVMIFAGGEPLRHGDEVVGAVGVSGGSGEQDQAVATAAAAAL